MDIARNAYLCDAYSNAQTPLWMVSHLHFIYTHTRIVVIYSRVFSTAESNCVYVYCKLYADTEYEQKKFISCLFGMITKCDIHKRRRDKSHCAALCMKFNQVKISNWSSICRFRKYTQTHTRSVRLFFFGFFFIIQISLSLVQSHCSITSLLMKTPNVPVLNAHSL